MNAVAVARGNNNLMATGGNDRVVCLWDLRNATVPLAKLAEHGKGMGLL